MTEPAAAIERRHKHVWSAPFMHHDRDPYGYGVSYVAKWCPDCGKIRALSGRELVEGFRQIAESVDHD